MKNNLRPKKYVILSILMFHMSLCTMDSFTILSSFGKSTFQVVARNVEFGN